MDIFSKSVFSSQDYLKLNYDGSAAGNPGMAGVGGLVHNEKGVVLLSYSGPVGFGSINKAELMALNIGLQEPFRLNLQNLIVEGGLVSFDGLPPLVIILGIWLISISFKRLQRGQAL